MQLKCVQLKKRDGFYGWFTIGPDGKAYEVPFHMVVEGKYKVVNNAA